MKTAVEFQPPAEVKQHIDRRDLRAYDSDVAEMVMLLVNGFNIRYRFTGSAMMLFPPDNSKDPWKISPKRPGKTQLIYLEKFAKEHLNPEARAEAGIQVSARDLHKLAKAINGAEHQVEDTWELVLKAGNKQPTGFEVNQDGIFRCIRCLLNGEVYTTTSRVPHGGHNRGVHRDATYSKEAREKLVNDWKNFHSKAFAHMSKGFEVKKDDELVTVPKSAVDEVVRTGEEFASAFEDMPVFQERPIQEAIDLLLGATGRGDDYVANLHKRVKQLEEQLAAEVSRREEAEAKIQVIQDHVREVVDL